MENPTQGIDQEWLKENWFKLGIILAIFVLAFSIYGNKNPKAVKPTAVSNSLELAAQCRRDGEKKHQEDIDTATSLQYRDGAQKCYYMEPKYLFNKDLNTCLYSGGYTCELSKKYTEGIFAGTSANRWTRHITDIYTNKTIVDVSVSDSSNVSDLEQRWISDFWLKSKELGFEE